MSTGRTRYFSEQDRRDLLEPIATKSINSGANARQTLRRRVPRVPEAGRSDQRNGVRVDRRYRLFPSDDRTWRSGTGHVASAYAPHLETSTIKTEWQIKNR